MLLNCGVRKDSWESLGLARKSNQSILREISLSVHWKDWHWSWNSNTLATWYEELIHLKRPWCWERLRAGREGDNRGWDGWMASPTQWTWVWVNSGSWWWTGRPGVLQSMGSQRIGHDWVTELNYMKDLSYSILLKKTPFCKNSQKRVFWKSLHLTPPPWDQSEPMASPGNGNQSEPNN